MRSHPVGDQGLLVVVADAKAAFAVRQLVLDHVGSGDHPTLVTPVDVVPAAETVLLSGLPGRTAQAAWQDWCSSLSPADLEPLADSGTGQVVTIDTSYDGEDLDVVAKAWGCSAAAVVARHIAAEFVVAFCGFAPGFAYCLPREPLPVVPRRDSPRERVPGGSVAMAGEFCGVYPMDMPGGWQLVGRTTAVLFDPGRDQPALLTPGDTVRFKALE